MCLILFAYGLHAERPLVVAANRDEFYARPALAAHWWRGDDGEADIFGGRDVEAGGTWLAIAGDGRLAAVTNWTERESARKPPGSRGELPHRFLDGTVPAGCFAAAIEGERYAGFNFVAFDGEELSYASNRTGEVRRLRPGVYGLTNTRLGAGLSVGRCDSAVREEPSSAAPPRRAYDDWPKAVIGAAALQRIAADASPDDLIGLLSQPLLPMETPDDREQSPERSYSPCFIHGSNYGTRASTAIVVGRDSLQFVEQLYGPFGKPGERTEMRVAFARPQPKDIP